MTVREAVKKGYSYYGYWGRSWEHDKVKAKAAELRKAGNKAIMVCENGGTNIYWIESLENARVRRIESLNSRIKCAMYDRSKAQAEIDKANNMIAECQAEIAELQG
jgi:hypothetical protein